MHRNDTSRFLLYIEPNKEEKLKEPIKDELTKLMDLAFDNAIPGSANYSDINKPEFFYDSGWRGWHNTDCGEKSDCNDYFLENGMIVNSLCVFYVRWYRNSIHKNDWLKLIELGKFYGIEILEPKNYPVSKQSSIKDTRTSIKKIEDMMIEELSKQINEKIIENIKSNNLI